MCAISLLGNWDKIGDSFKRNLISGHPPSEGAEGVHTHMHIGRGDHMALSSAGSNMSCCGTRVSWHAGITCCLR